MILVSYDLKQPGRDYSKLYSVLKTVPYHRPLESVWILDSRETAEAWSQKVLAHIDPNDRALIIDITNDSMQGWLAKASWEWIQARQQAVR